MISDPRRALSPPVPPVIEQESVTVEIEPQVEPDPLGNEAA
jgi:hypothetical protein